MHVSVKQPVLKGEENTCVDEVLTNRDDKLTEENGCSTLGALDAK